MIRIGCTGYPINQKRYQSTFNIVEMNQFLEKAPRRSTIEKWKRTCPSHFDFVLCAPRLITHPTLKHRTSLSFSDSASLRRSWFNLIEASNILNAKIILFELPANAAPTPDQIGRMQLFFKTVRRDRVSYVWAPPRHWPSSLIESLSHSLDLVPATDPLQHEITHKSPFRYLRVGRTQRMGGFHPLTDKELETIRKTCGSGLTYVIFNSGPFSFQDATRFSILCHRS